MNERQSQPEFQAPPASPRRGACLWVALALVLAPLVFALVAAVMALGGITQAYNTVNDMFTGRQVLRTDQPAVINQIRQLSRLETSSFTIEKVIEGGVQQDNPLLNTLLGDRLLFIAHGEVLAGVDLTEMQEGDITVHGDQSVTVRLPGARVLSKRLDNEQSRVYDRQTGPLARQDPNLETQVRQAAEHEIVTAACQGGILAQANANAENQVRALLMGLGFTRVDFEPARPAADSGC